MLELKGFFGDHTSLSLVIKLSLKVKKKLVLESAGFLEPSRPIGQEPISCFLRVSRLDVREDSYTPWT